MNQQISQPMCWSVSGLVQAISSALQTRFSSISVKGEISNFSQASSGHCYFVLKDEVSQLRCAMFQRAARMLSSPPKNGDEVEIRGRIAIYEQRGELQIIVESMRPVGQGRLLEQFQYIKAKLEREGLFDAQRKMKLPSYPQTIGVISSLQAAALQDVLTSIRRRAPHIRVIIYPASVQGKQATQELINAIATASQRQEVDIILLCRGGGSLEDLWCFNEEALVRAISACRIPIIAGVGHETDFTLADFVADMRAPTPTAAAELAVYAQKELILQVTQLFQRLNKQIFHQLESYAYRVDRASLSLEKPAHQLRTQHQKIEQLTLKMRYAFNQGLASKMQRLTEQTHKQASAAQHLLQSQQHRFQQASQHWSHCLSNQVQQKHQHLNELCTKMNALNPVQVLSRGYAWISTKDGSVVRSSKQVHAGDTIQAHFVDGQLDATVLQSIPDLFPIDTE